MQHTPNRCRSLESSTLSVLWQYVSISSTDWKKVLSEHLQELKTSIIQSTILALIENLMLWFSSDSQGLLFETNSLRQLEPYSFTIFLFYNSLTWYRGAFEARSFIEDLVEGAIDDVGRIRRGLERCCVDLLVLLFCASKSGSRFVFFDGSGRRFKVAQGK